MGGTVYKVHDGDFVASTEYWGTNLSSLYIEGIRPGNYTIKMELDPNGVSGYISSDTVVVTVPGVDLDIDSDNTKVTEPPERTAEEDEIEDSTTEPGKVISVNAGDADLDGIPDFADGFNRDGLPGSKDDSSGTNALVPLIIEIPSEIDVTLGQVVIGYNLPSNPQNVSYDPSTKTWSAPGNLRIWRKNGNEPRNKMDLSSGGDFVAPGTYSLSQLGFSWQNPVTLYVEGIAPSQSLADREISIQLFANATATASTEDSVRLTVMNTELVGVVDETTTGPVAALKDSHPSPVFSANTTAHLSSVYLSEGSGKLLGVLHVSGTVTSTLCDLVPGSNGKIENIKVRVNGENVTSSGTIATSPTKTTDPTSLTRPYPMVATFSWSGEVEVTPGQNIFELEASDSVPGVGLTGFIEFTTVVTARPIVAVQGASVGPDSFPEFTYDASQSEVLAKSLGGELNTYFTQLIGPSELFEKLRKLPGARIVKRLDNKYYKADSRGQAEPNVLMYLAKSSFQTWTDTINPAFKACMVMGILMGGGDMVVGSVKLVGAVGEAGFDGITLPVVVNNASAYGIQIPWAENRIEQLGTKIDDMSSAVRAVSDFIIKVGASEYATLEAISRLDWQDANKESEPLRVLCSSAVELMWELQQEYSESEFCERGKTQGRVAFEVLSIVVPETKLGQVSKLAVLEKLQTIPWIASNERVLRAIAKAITAFKRLPEFCFIAGTQVHTEKGFRPIESIHVGDRVLARDTYSGHQTFKSVLATVTTHPDRLYHLTYRAREPHRSSNNGETEGGGDDSDDDQPSKLSCSAPHPFYVKGLKRFVAASELEIGQEFLLASGGGAVLERIEIEDSPNGQTFTTYNFEVADYHTYFVGSEGVWVHNQGLNACQQIDTLTRTLIQKGQPRREAILEAMKQVSANTGIHKVTHRLRDSADFMLDGLPNNPNALHMADVFTVKDYLSLKARKKIRVEHDGFGWVIKPGAEGMRGHHIVVERIQEELRVRLGVSITDIDDSPVKVFTHAEHYGSGPNSLHNLMNAWNPPPNSTLGSLHPNNLGRFNTPTELVNELIRFYKTQPNNPDWVRMVKATRGWAAKHGIPFNE